MELLEKLYGNVLVPNAVYHELTENPAYPEEIEIIKTVEFFSVTDVENIKSVNVLRSVTGLEECGIEALIMYDKQKECRVASYGWT